MFVGLGFVLSIVTGWLDEAGASHGALGAAPRGAVRALVFTGSASTAGSILSTIATAPLALEISRDGRRAFLSLPDPRLREQILRGIERMHTQALKKQYTLVIGSMFEQTARLMRELVSRHRESGEARIAESLDLLLTTLEEVYVWTARDLPDIGELAEGTSRWVGAAQEIMEQDQRLTDRAIDFLTAIRRAAPDEGQVAELVTWRSSGTPPAAA